MIFDIVKLAVGAGTHIMGNRQKRKMFESDAALKHSEAMAKGEIEYQATVRNSNDQGFKDEFVLILVSLPILVLIWSIFSDDPDMKSKLDTFFEQFKNLPYWYQGLFLGICGSIYGLRGIDLLKGKK